MARHIPRVYCERALAVGDSVELQGDAAHHLLRVLRLRPGHTVMLFNGRGGEYSAEVDQAERHRLSLRLIAANPVSRESPLYCTLLQGIARGERMDYSIGKAVELGVSQIQPLMLDYSQGLDGQRLARKLAHWRAVAQSAAEQSGRTCLPLVADVCSFAEWLAQAVEHDLKLMLHPGRADVLENRGTPQSVALLVGPEGGLSAAEVTAAEAAGFAGLSLGPRILRTETAGVAALAILQSRWGDGLNQS